MSARRIDLTRVRFGAAYYLEYQPGDTLARDMDLMTQAHFSVIRVGESVWSTWEPRNGVFDLEWLAPVLDAAHAHDIQVILGTPTYAVPPWLFTSYPEIAGEHSTGVPMPWGARQEVDITHPTFRFHAERVIRAICARYAQHPAIVGYQVDNEPGPFLLHNRATFRAFVDWLKDRYGDPETLNQEWGLVYWSHRISSFDELWSPTGNAQPQYDRAWREFQNDQVTEFIAWQAQLVREYARPDQFVTTCLALDRPATNDAQLGAVLDVTAVNPYYAMQDHLDLTKQLGRPESWVRTGVSGLLLSADRSFGVRQERFLVTETNAQAIGFSGHNLPPYPGQLIQAGLALVSRGAAMVEYWHWHTNHYGTETYWGGILPHSQRPGRVYQELSELGEILQNLGTSLDGYQPDADVTFLWSTESKHALEFQPPFPGDEPRPPASYVQRNPAAYHDIVESLYNGAIAAGAQARILNTEQFDDLDVDDLVARYPVLVAAGLYITTDAQLARLVEYANRGGHVVVGIRTGYADHEARARVAVAPAVIGPAAGMHYEEFSNLAEPIPVTGSAAHEIDAAAAATRWLDGVLVDDAEVVASYDHPEFGRFAAVTRRGVGSGSITYVGTVPNLALARSVMATVVAPVNADWVGDPSVTVMSGTVTQPLPGTRIWFVHNWSGAQASVTVPVAVHDQISAADVAPGTPLQLPPWGVAILTRQP